MEYGELMRRLWSHVNVGDKVTVQLVGPPEAKWTRWDATWAREPDGPEASRVRVMSCGDTPEEAILRLCMALERNRRQRAAWALAKGATVGQEQAAGGQGQA